MKPRIDTAKLKQPNIREKFTLDLKNKFEALEDLQNAEVDYLWQKIKKAFTSTSEDILVFCKANFKDWITDDTREAIEKRKECKGVLTKNQVWKI